jgi:murein DD-endopeptidase
MRALLLSIVTLLLGCAPAFAQNVAPDSPAKQKAHIVPIALSVPVPPTAFRGDGLFHLCYEIHLTNLSASGWTVQNIQVTNQSGAPLFTVEGNALDGVLFHPAKARDAKPSPGANIAPGEAVIAYMWIDLPNGAAIPTGLQSHLSVKRNDTGQTVDADVPSVNVLTRVPAIMSPLRGNSWVAANGPSNTSQHRRAMIVVDGTAHISQRYAIDWVQVGADYKTYQGDPKDNRSYHCFGVEAHAIADATVVETKDGLPENVPGEKPVVSITLETIAGNHINLDLGTACTPCTRICSPARFA